MLLSFKTNVQETQPWEGEIGKLLPKFIFSSEEWLVYTNLLQKMN